MRDAGGKQPDGCEFIVLDELILEPDAVGDVVDNDQRSASVADLIHK
jgi:hypothetical protein